MTSTLEAPIFMGKEYSENLRSNKKYKEQSQQWNRCLTCLKKLIVGHSDEIMEWPQLIGRILHVNNYLWLVMKKSSVSRTRRFAYFLILCYAMERCTRTHNQRLSGKTSWRGSKVHQNTELWTQLTENRWNSSGNFRRIHYIAARPRSPKVPFENEHRARRIERTDHLHVDLKKTSHGDLKTINRNATWASSSFLFVRKDFHQEEGHSSYMDQKRSGILLMLTDHKENGTESLNWWWSNSEKADTQFSVPRVHCPEEHSKAKEVEIFLYTSELMENDWNRFFAQSFVLISSVSTEQSQFCVKNAKLAMLERWDQFWQDNLTHCLCQQVCWWMHLHIRPMILRKKIYCESTKNEWKGYHSKIVWLSFVLMQDFWQQLESDSISWQRTLKNSHSSQNQWHVVSTFCQEMKKTSDPKGSIRGNTKIGPVLEVRTSYLQGKYGMEIRIESVNRQFSLVGQNFSWLEQVGHGLDRQKSTTTTSRKPLRWSLKNWRLQADQRIKQKPRRPSTTCSTSRTIHILERTWIDILPESQFDQAPPVAKRFNTLLWHGELPREDEAIEFWRLKDYLRNHFEQSQYWSDEVWKSKMAGGGGYKKIFQYCTDPSRDILHLRALHGHSGRNLISHWSFITGQCINSGRFLRVHLSHRMCNHFTLHREFRIDTWRTNVEQKTDGIHYVCGNYEQRT